MTTFRKTLETYKKGHKAMAYLLFKNDPNANEGVTFDDFCKSMDKIIGNVHSVDPVTGKKELA